VRLGATVVVAGRTFTVVGHVRSTLFAATPTLYVTLDDARRLSVGGAPLASAVLVRGVPVEMPPGLRSLTRSQAVDDAMEPLTSANATIALVRTLLWLVAALGVGSVLYLNAVERTRDMAVFKATGSSARSVAAGVVVQAVFVAVAAAAVGCGVAALLAPRFPMPAEIPLGAYLSLPVVALVLALVGSAGGVRRALVVPPALAFGAQ
jgi:putative ABC transport system permease protein